MAGWADARPPPPLLPMRGCNVNYLDLLAPKLKDLAGQRIALQEIPESLHTLELACEALQVAGADCTKISGKPSKEEEALLANLAERDYLRRNLVITRRQVEQLERALAKLDENEKLVVERLYIDRKAAPIKQLCAVLECEESTVYEIRYRATVKLARMLFGQVDL